MSRFAPPAALLLCISLTVPGCSLFGTDTRTLVMPVESLAVAESITVGEPLAISLTGLLTNGCQSFERLQVDRLESGVRLTMFARETLRPGTVCTDDVRLVEVAHTAYPQAAGIFTIQVKQPPHYEPDLKEEIHVHP
jgi:hypothetical protein